MQELLDRLNKELYGLCEIKNEGNIRVLEDYNYSLGKFESKDEYFIVYCGTDLEGVGLYKTINKPLDELAELFIQYHKPRAEEYLYNKRSKLITEATKLSDKLFETEAIIESIDNKLK